MDKTTEAQRPHPEWDEHIAHIVDAAPPLTPAQRDRLAILLRPEAGPSIADIHDGRF